MNPLKIGDITRMHKQCVSGLSLGEEGPGDETTIFTDCGRIQKRVRFAFTLVIIILMCWILSQCKHPNTLLFYVLVIKSEESEVQTETKLDEDKPGGCFNWSKF